MLQRFIIASAVGLEMKEQKSLSEAYAEGQQHQHGHLKTWQIAPMEPKSSFSRLSMARLSKRRTGSRPDDILLADIHASRVYSIK